MDSDWLRELSDEELVFGLLSFHEGKLIFIKYLEGVNGR